MSSDETYGSPSGQHNSTIEYAENALIGGVAGKKVFPINLPPTAQTNPSLVLSYDESGNLTRIDKVIGGITYFKTFSYTGSELTGVSAWSV